MIFSQLSTAKPLIDRGQLRALGIASKRAAPRFPMCRRSSKPGMPGFEAVSWYALMAPARTPDAIIAKLRDGTVAAINAPDVRPRWRRRARSRSATRRPSSRP